MTDNHTLYVNNSWGEAMVPHSLALISREGTNNVCIYIERNNLMPRGRPRKTEPAPREIYNGWYARKHDDFSMRIWHHNWPGDTFDIVSNDKYKEFEQWHRYLLGTEVKFLDLHDMYEPGDNQG